MTLRTVLALLALAAPAAAQSAPPAAVHVRVTARTVIVDRDAFTRAGIAYVAIGNDRVHVSRTTQRPTRGARIAVGTHGLTAFLEAARENRLLHSESTQQVLALSGAEAIVSSTTVSLGRRSARTTGPVLAVLPTLLEDGRIHLYVAARVEDSVSWPWGYGVDGSPAAVETEVIARAGEEVILASSSITQQSRESGILRWAADEHGRDVLITVSVQVIPD
ncbi:MAG TPA: hypothetical protein VFZ69_00660 [Longimicrobiales bacterium]